VRSNTGISAMSPLLLGRVLALTIALALLAPASRAQYDSPFMQEFRKLMQIKADDEMAVLMRKNEVSAILSIIDVCETIGKGSSDQLEAEVEALGRIWKKLYGTRFVEIEYNYFSVDLPAAMKKHRTELIDKYRLLRNEFDLAEKAKDSAKLFPLGETFNALGDEFGELGDGYMAAQCYRTYAACFEDTLNGAKADLRKACEGWGLFLQARDSIDLKMADYDQVKVRYDTLVAGGFDAPAAEGGGEGGEAAPSVSAASASAAVPLNGAFEVVPDIEVIRRPLFTADSAFQVWTAVPMDKVGSKGVFNAMDESPAVLRTGSSKASVDVNGDGKGDVDIPLTGKITPVQITLGQGEAARPWAFLAVIGAERDTYQGINPWNLAPNDDQMSIYVAGAASLVGTLNGVRVRVIDDNLDGRYGSEPKNWRFPGLIEGADQPDVDTVVVGDAQMARPWSRVQKVGEAWFELAANEAGTDILATPAQVQSGTLQLDLKGLPVAWLMVRGIGEEGEGRYYEVVNGGTNKVEVPAGAYELYAGQIATGKKNQMMKALILPGRNTRAWKVGAGETTKLELGMPMKIEFDVKQDESTVTVVGSSIVAVGRGGETYQRLWNCVLTPELNIRKAGSTKARKETKLIPITSQEQLADHNNDWATAWFPIGEPIEKTVPGETFEVQLFEKKHKLFGKLESDWKGK
jgi:hypothetical protein